MRCGLMYSKGFALTREQRLKNSASYRFSTMDRLPGMCLMLQNERKAPTMAFILFKPIVGASFLLPAVPEKEGWGPFDTQLTKSDIALGLFCYVRLSG